MKLRLRWLIVTALVAVGLAHGSWNQIWTRLTNQFDSNESVASFRISHTYLLDRLNWLEFHVPSTGELAWVLATANFYPKVPEPPSSNRARPGAIFAIDYEIVDSKGKPLDEGTYHFRSVHPDSEQGAAGAKAFYSDTNLVPAAGQSMRLRLSKYAGQASSLRLREAKHDESIRDVSIRVYYQEEVPDYKLNHAWRRTPQQKQEHLCRASVYGPELLTEHEKRNLLRRRWRPLACVGLEGRDYQRRILYSPTDEEGHECGLGRPAGLLIDRDSHGVVPLPDGCGTVRLVMMQWPGEEPTEEPAEEPAEVTVLWHGGRSDKIERWHTILSTTEQEMELDSREGTLDIVATQELVVRAYWRDSRSEGPDFVDITPAVDSVPAYVINPESPVEYLITHVEQQPTPVKLAFRATLPPDNSQRDTGRRPSAECTVTWSFLADDGSSIARGHCEIEPAASRYDRVARLGGPIRVTDAAVHYFAIPSNVRRVRLESAQHDLLVSAYSRPPDVANVTFVPEDYSVFRRGESGRRRWFVTRPTEHNIRTNEMRTAVVLIQPRPVEVDPQLAAGEHEWHSFQPRGAANSRFLLVARDPKADLRWEAVGAAYYPLETAAEHEVTIRHAPGHRWVRPHLICQCETEGSIPLRVFVDGHLHQQLTIRRGLNDIALEALPASEDRRVLLRLETAGNVRAMMNHVTGESATVYLKRMVTRIEGNTLEFDYEKRDPVELLALSLFHTTTGHRARLRVRIVGGIDRGTGPHHDWTPCLRVYELEPSQAASALLFTAGGKQVFEQEPCYLRLGSDLPPATYTIQVTREDDDEGYLLLSRTTPGVAERRSLGTEPEPQMDGQLEHEGR